jgi:ATP-binding cassette subfamily F protein uup
LEKKKERDVRDRGSWSAPVATPKGKPAAATASNKPRKLTFKEQRELEGIEEAIMTAESRAQELDALLNDPQFYVTRSQEAAGLIKEMEGAKTEAMRLYARWEELEAIKAASGVA